MADVKMQGDTGGGAHTEGTEELGVEETEPPHPSVR